MCVFKKVIINAETIKNLITNLSRIITSNCGVFTKSSFVASKKFNVISSIYSLCFWFLLAREHDDNNDDDEVEGKTEV